MMKRIRSTLPPLRAFLLVAVFMLLLTGSLIALLSTPAPSLASAPVRMQHVWQQMQPQPAATPSPQEALHHAWKQAQAAGAYRFTADTEQTLIPRPIPGMIGQTDQRVDTRITGEVTLPDYARMTLQFEGAGLNEEPLTLIQDGAESYVVKDGEKIAVDNPASLSSPTADYLGYLAAAENVQIIAEAEGASQFTRFSYDINGQLFAEYVRDQIQAELQGEVPAGVRLEPSPLLAAMSGQGELWVDEAGMPVRQIVDLDMPGVTEEYDARVHMVVDFDFTQAVAASGAKTPQDSGVMALSSGITGAVADGRSTVSQLPLAELSILLVSLLLAAVLIGYRQHRRVYAAVVIAITTTMVASPLLQAGNILRFEARIAHASSGTNHQLAVISQQLVDDQLSTDEQSAALTQSQPEATNPTSQMPRAQSTAASSPELYCGKGSTEEDADNDGLSDAAENCLGTDPEYEDSDRDLITDTVEIDGFDYGGKHWVSDPFRIDSNADGLSDYAEWPEPIGVAPKLDGVDDWDPDGDGVPNLWDADNDGDGVPDSLDLSPFARTAYSDTFSLSIQGGGFDGYVYIGFQLQPENMDHLRYSVTALDWPYDEQGQIQDLDDSLEDIRLTPVIKIKTNLAPDRDLIRNQGVTIFEDGDDFILYITPTMVDDGGRIVAFSSILAYRPDQLDDIRWDDVELLWMVMANLDQQVGDEIITTPTPLNPYVEESFRITGLQIEKSRQYQSALVGTPANADEDRWLFNLIFGMSNTYLTHQNPDLQELEHRFTSPNTPIVETWGVPVDKISIDLPAQAYAHRDAGITDLQTRINNFLNIHNYPTDGNASLIIATQEETGLYGLDDQGVLESEASFNLNLGDVSMSTMRGLKSGTYRYEEGDWVSLDLPETIEAMQARYEDELSAILDDLHDDYPDLTEDDLKLMLEMFYTSWSIGQTRIIEMDGQPLAYDSRSDDDVFNEIHHNKEALPAYLIEATHLGDPGAGLRIGDNQEQIYAYLREQESKGNDSGFVLTSEMVMSLGIVRTTFAMRSTMQAVRFARATGSFAGRMRIFSDNAGAGGRMLGLAGTIVTALSLWTMFLVTASSSGWDWSSPAVRSAAAYAAVATVFTVILFVISLNPIGMIIVGILSILDLLWFFATWLFTGEGYSFMDSVVRAIASAFYNADVLTKLKEMDFNDFGTQLMDTELGLLPGNRYRFGATFVGSIWAESKGSRKDMRDSWVKARLDGSSSPVPAANKTGNKHCTASWWWHKTCENDIGVEWKFTTAQRNLKLSAKSSITAKTFYQECTLGKCKRKTQMTYLPGDLTDPSRWKSMDFYMDILPSTVQELWSWNDLINHDPDGDGLLNADEQSLGTDPNNWDSDGDGLSDKLEFDLQETLGADPLVADTDGDGLNDGLEYRIGTKINAKDSDDDGLEDGIEVFHQDAAGNWTGGWEITLPGRAEPVRVFSLPQVADTDGDGLNDRSEQQHATSPYAYNDSPHLTLSAHPQAQSPNGAQAVYVIPGDEVSMAVRLENRSPETITTTMTLCLPDFLTDLQFDPTLEGDRHPDAQAASSCNGLQWSFAAAEDALQEHEIVSATITATVASLIASASGDIELTLPYQVNGAQEDIVDQTTVKVDVEDPSATIVAPAEGALLGGGISQYVVGGSANDESSWVTKVEINLPGQGWVEAENISPWAYTWELPADGQYTLQARATDYLKHTGLSSAVNVTVDNTPPEVTLNLQEGEVVTTQSSDAISITLEGDASDNLSGLIRVQVSTDGRPWREVWAEGGAPLNAHWRTTWTIASADTAQGKHTVAVRAIDRAGNWTEPLRRTIIVDVVPPTSELTDRSYLLDPPPAVSVNETIDFHGVANDAGRVPQPSRPAELVGELDGLNDATIWLELASVTDDDDGVSMAWVGDFNGDRLADMAIGLPAAADGKGQVTIVYGRAGGWPTPFDAELLTNSPTSVVGKSGAGLGDMLTPAGDVNGDGFDDLLIGDAANARAFLLFGQATPVGRNTPLDAPNLPYWTLIDLSGLGALHALAAAGDVNGDGYDDLLFDMANSGKAYLLLGQKNPWWDRIPLDEKAAAEIDVNLTGAGVQGVGDMDGDDADEFVVADGNTVYLFEGRKDYQPGYGSPHETLALADAIATFGSAASPPDTAAPGDVNGDGLADFIYADGSQPKIVFGDADRNWSIQALDFTPAASGFLAAPGDVDDDGRADILVGNADGDAYLILGEDVTAVQATLTAVKAAASTRHPTGADLNGDGSSDLLLTPDTLGGAALMALDYGPAPHVPPDQLPLSLARPGPAIAQPFAASATATTRYVNDDGDCNGYVPCYAGIQAAVDAAATGDVIQVQPGVYASFTIDGVNDITIRGVHADAVFVDGGDAPFAVKVQNATGVTLENLTLRNADDALYLDAAGVGGYQDAGKQIVLNQVLIYDFNSHAVAMDRTSSLKLTRTTLAGSDNHLHLYGATDPAMDASWSTPSVDSRTATSVNGGLFDDGAKLYFVDDSGTIDVYDPASQTWSLLPEPTQGLYAAATGDEQGRLWMLRRDPDSGFDGPVYAIAYVSANEIYVGGAFTHAGQVETPYLARWDGSAWQPVTPDRGFAPNAPVHALLVNNGDIYAGGDFGLRYLPQGSLASWEDWGGINDGGTIKTLALHDGGIFVGGTFDDIGGITAHKLAKRKSDGSWVRIADPPNDSCNGVLQEGKHVSALTDVNNIMYIGGNFHEVGAEANGSYCRDPSVYGLAKSSGSSVYWISGTPRKSDLHKNSDIFAMIRYASKKWVVGGRISNVKCYYKDGYYDGWWPDKDYCTSDGTASNLALLTDKAWSVPDYLKANNVVNAIDVQGNRLLVGGEFSQVGDGVTAYRIAFYDNFPDSGGAWHALGGGLNAQVYAIAQDGDDVYAGGDFTLAGNDGAFHFAHWDGSQWVGLSEQALYEYDGSSWRKRATLPEFVGAGASIVSDGAGGLYAAPGSGSTAFYHYDIASNAWQKKRSLPGGLGAGGSLIWTGDALFALRGGDTRDLYRYDPATNRWDVLTAMPDPGPVIGTGGQMVWDGRDWLYVLAGGNGVHFLRYHIRNDRWETLPDAPGQVDQGGGLARIDQRAYGVPGGDHTLWGFDPIAIYPEKLTLDHVAIIAPETSPAATWINMDDLVSDDFVVSGTGNGWVGNQNVDWSPDPTLPNSAQLTYDDARLLDPDRDVYRLSSGSKLDAGYHRYRPDYTVQPCDGADCGSPIQDGINSGANRVLLKAGAYKETFYLLSGVEVVGESADLTMIEPEVGASAPAVVRAEGVVGAKLSMMTIHGANSGVDGLRAEDGGSLIVKQTILRDAAIGLHVSGDATQVEVVNNTIVYNDDGMVADVCAPVDVRNTIFAENAARGLGYESCATRKLHKYNLFWQNGVDLDPNDPGAGELFLDPLFVDPGPPSHDYHTEYGSPVIDAGDPGDLAPPGAGVRIDIGYIDQNRAGLYVDDDYCETCANDGLSWQVDAFDSIQDALNKADANIHDMKGLRYTVGVAAGTYTETLLVPSYVRLVGRGAEESILHAPDGVAPAVTFDGVVQSEIRGFTIQGAANTTAISVTHASNAITITRNLIETWNTADQTAAVAFGDRATGLVSFNTMIDYGWGSGQKDSGVLSSGPGTWVSVQNNMVSGEFNQDNWINECGVNYYRRHEYGLRTQDSGQIFTAYNLLWANKENYRDDAGTGLTQGPGDLVNTDPCFDHPSYHLLVTSKARDAASPQAEIPPGGGQRADMGYHELTATPASVFLGREDVSVATGNSGVQQVEIGFSLVSDPNSAVTDTLPATWTPVTLDSPEESVSYWNESFAPTQNSLYRVYSRATDVAGNRESDKKDWYEGAFVADSVTPAVTWALPADGSILPTPLELRAQVSDYAAEQFSVDDFYFLVDGVEYQAEWAADPWDEQNQDPRTFRAWVDLSQGEHSAYAVATDRTGNRGQSAPITFTVSGENPTDTTPPLLTVVAPAEGSWFTRTVTFSGTVTDAGSGVASVGVSLDGGYTWHPATVDGSDWQWTWDAPADQKYVSYPARVRARDQAGNESQVSRTFSIDNVPPLGPEVESFVAVLGLLERDSPPGTHFDVPLAPLPANGLRITWSPPVDGSGIATTLIAVDQFTDTTPTDDLGALTTITRALDAPGDWYVHLAGKDGVGNQFIRHFGPWHVGTFQDLTTDFAQRVQTIQIDGDLRWWERPNEQVDDLVATAFEWGVYELMDEYLRRAKQSVPDDWWDPQAWFTTWDGANLYLGWQGAWWTLDGELMAYVSIDDQGCSQLLPSSNVCTALPFKANYAINIQGPEDGALWECVGGNWQAATGIDWEFAQGESGGTEIRLGMDMTAVSDLNLLAFALDDEGEAWAAFPTTNTSPDKDLCSDAFHWTDLGNISEPSQGQPSIPDTQLIMKSPQAPQAAWCPGSTLQYVFTVENLETFGLDGLDMEFLADPGLSFLSVEGATCDNCLPGNDAWAVSLPTVETGSHVITVTAQLDANLGALSSSGVTGNLVYSNTLLASGALQHHLDTISPTIHIASVPGQVIGNGLQGLSGVADDDGGSGLAQVQFSIDGGATWQNATGLRNWQATFETPAGATELTMQARAIDACGYTSDDMAIFAIDNTAPSLFANIPAFITGNTDTFGGVATDNQGRVSQIQVQFDDENGFWRNAQVYAPDQHRSQNWRFTWAPPYEDCTEHTLRVRAQDNAGNITTTDWLTTTVDTIAPALTVTQTMTEVSINDPGQPLIMEGSVGDGCGVSSLEVVVYAPDGASYRDAIPLQGDRWQYTPDLSQWMEGDYKLRVEAKDSAGNATLRGAFTVRARSCLNATMTSTFLNAVPDGQVRIDASITNHGAGNAPDGLSVAFYADGDLIGTKPITQMLGAGETHDLNIDWQPASSGAYSITIAINDDGTGAGSVDLCQTPTDTGHSVSILDVPLVESWNLISSYADPFNPDITVVQRPITGAYSVIQGFDSAAQSYYPDLPPGLNTLTDMDGEHGYWVRVNEGVTPTLRFVGQALAPDHPLALVEGWNLVSYLPRVSMPVTVALQSIEGYYSLVQGFDGGARSYYPDLPPEINTLKVMKPMFGYWIHATEAVSLTYPAGQQAISTADTPPATRTTSPHPSDQVLPTNVWVDFYGSAQTLAGAPLPAGTVVQALDPDGVVCGKIVISTPGLYGLLPCYGDDPDTSQDEGARVGDNIRLMINNHLAGTGVWNGPRTRQEISLIAPGAAQEPLPIPMYLPLINHSSTLH